MSGPVGDVRTSERCRDQWCPAVPQVGNKKDLDAEREVTFLEASRFAQENELMFLETSALTGEHIDEAFLKCSNTILAKIETGQ